MTGYFKKNTLSLFLLCLLLVVISSSPTNADCNTWVLSASALPVENVNVTWMNGATNATLDTSATDASGHATYAGNCVNISTRYRFPSSAYTAVLRNASVLSDVHVNDMVTARIQLINTLGQYLEGQDCSVVVYESNTSNVVHDYNTQCKYGEPYIDTSGNWVATSDCKFTDSLGWYYFQGRTDESMGYKFNEEYDLIFTCNGKTDTVTFQLDIEKQPADSSKIEEYAMRYGGWIVAVCLIGLFIVVAAAFIVVLVFRQKGSPGQ